MKGSFLATGSKHLSTLALLVGIGVAVGTWAGETGMPAMQHAGQVAYVTGGIGVTQSDAFKREVKNYPLALEIVQHEGGKNLYAAGADVRIVDAHGQVVLQAVADGPFVLVDLPAGRYSVDVTLDGHVKHQSVTVAENASVHKLFVFPSG